MTKRSPQLTVLTQLFYPELISTGQTVTELCEALSEKGVAIQVLCGYPTLRDTTSSIPKTMMHYTITIRRLWGTRFPKLNLIGRIVNQVTFFLSILIHLIRNRRSKTPYLVFTNPPFMGVAAAFSRLIGGAPFHFVVFDVYPETAIQCGVLSKKGIVARIWRCMNRFVYRHATSIIVLGRCMESVIKPQLRPSDYSKLKRIHIWANDPNLKRIEKRHNPFIKNWMLQDQFVCLYSGNMGRFHDIKTFIDAAVALQAYPDITFVFVGDGHQKQWATEYALSHRLANVQFHDYVERDQLSHSLSVADIGLVSLKEGQEGLSVPSKTFGLLSVGVPVLAMMAPSCEIAQVVTEMNCGAQCQPGDAQAVASFILQLKQDPEYRMVLQENAFNASRRFSLSAAADAYYGVIFEKD